MGVRKLKIVIWCGPGANQKALANKMAAEYDVAGIVIDTHSGRHGKRKLNGLPAILWDRLRFHKIYRAWTNLMRYYNIRFPTWPDSIFLKVENINTKDTEIFTNALQPDLIVVSGTALIKEPLLSIPVSTGILNLHTGLSPYVKGGPNCTNWCIANNSFQLVGNTIMWLNAGIDTGNIITTETVNIQDAENLTEAHQKVMENAHDLYLRTIGYLSGAKLPYASVPQSSIDKGQLYLAKMWTAAKRKEVLKNWKKRKSFAAQSLPITVALENNR